MKIFKRSRRQSGYCTISEPVSDLAPEVISAIKANTEYQTTDNRKILHSPFQDSSESDAITESITLTPTPSESSSPAPQSRTCSVSLVRPGKIKLNRTSDKNGSQPKKISSTPPRSKSVHGVGKSSLKTPVQSSARVTESSTAKVQKDCQTTQETTKSFDVTTEAPTERMDLFNLDNKSHTNKNNGRDFNPSEKNENELDRSFDPEIVSVDSDVTEPTYGTLDAGTSCEYRWKKLRQGNKRLTELLGSRDNSQLSIFDFVIDALCQYPTDSPTNEKRSRP